MQTASIKASAVRPSGVSVARGQMGPTSLAILLAAVAAGVCGLLITEGEFALRGLVALVVYALLLALIESDRESGLLYALGYLAFLALLRRLLIPVAGWTPLDPLLLVGPAVAATLVIRNLVAERRPAAPDLLSRLVLALLALSLLQTINPNNGSIIVGVVGLLFMGAPLLWFFNGREMLSGRAPERLLWLVCGLGGAISAYGLVQAFVGPAPWDMAWINLVEYRALRISPEEVSAFGTFASSAEFSIFAGITVVVAFSLLLSGKFSAAPALAIAAPALLLSSSRTALVMTVLAIIILLVLRSVPPRAVAPALLACVLVAVIAAPTASSVLVSVAGESENERVAYQLGGIGDPLGSERSTVALHWTLFIDGMRRGITNPIGAGTGATNRASSVSSDGSSRGSTEVDVSDVFISLGVAGGLIYLAAIIVAFRQAARNFVARRDAFSLATLGVMIVAIGTWFNGGHYAVSALIWLMLGVTAARAHGSPSSSSA